MASNPPSSIFSLSPSSFVTLYSDCLQARRHFPVKVSLMNSNDLTDCLRQVIHNHSSSTLFPLCCPPHRPVLSTRTLPVTGNKKKGQHFLDAAKCTHCCFFSFLLLRNSFFFVSSAFNWTCCIAALNPFASTLLLLLCHEDGCSHSLLWWSEAGSSAISGKGGRESWRARGRRLAQSESCFSHQAAESNARAHRLPQQTNLRVVDLTPK